MAMIQQRRTGRRRSARRRPPGCATATVGRFRKNTAGSNAKVKRSAAKISGGRVASPNLMTTKLVPHTATTASASSRCSARQALQRASCRHAPGPRGPASWPPAAPVRPAPASAPRFRRRGARRGRPTTTRPAPPRPCRMRSRRHALAAGARGRRAPAARGCRHQQHELLAAPARQHVGAHAQWRSASCATARSTASPTA